MNKNAIINRLILLLGLLTWGLTAQCQPATTYVQLSSADVLPNILGRNVIVRNYDNQYEVIAYIDCSNPEQHVEADLVLQSTTFLIRDMQSGQVTHLGTLPEGYQVNDVCFVRLGKRSPTTDSMDFCCFCGTHYGELIQEVQPSGKPGSPANHQFGFAGYFSMKEAMFPQPTYSIKIREVEKTLRLDRMVGYGEQEGASFAYVGNPYRDNAVLDIVGHADGSIPIAASCLCRVKFYPECTSGTRWYNSMGFFADPSEELVDISKMGHDENPFATSIPNSSDLHPKGLIYQNINIDPNMTLLIPFEPEKLRVENECKVEIPIIHQ